MHTIIFVFLSLFIIKSCGYNYMPIRHNAHPAYHESQSAWEKFAITMSKRYQLNILNYAPCYFKPDPKFWGVLFSNSDFITIDQARFVMVDLVKNYLNLIYQDPSFKERLLDYPSQKEINIKTIEQYLGIKVATWDKDVNRPMRPYIADMIYQNGSISYFYANPDTQALELALTETFGEAIQILKTQNQ